MATINITSTAGKRCAFIEGQGGNLSYGRTSYEAIGLLVEALPESSMIAVRNRANDIHACLRTDSTIWGCGRNNAEAIGNLVSHWPEAFGFTVNWIGS